MNFRQSSSFGRYAAFRKTKSMVFQAMTYSLLFMLIYSARSEAGPVTSNRLEPDLTISDRTTELSDQDIDSHADMTASRSGDDDLDTNADASANRHVHHHQRHPNSPSAAELQHDSAPGRHTVAEYIDMCREGRIADNSGVSWKNNLCETCRCQGRSIVCDQEVCPDLSCDNPVSVEGKCCQMCPEKICEAADGRRFTDGAEWHLDDCTFCECRKGRVLCSVEDCEYKSCANPVKVPGQCCPVCPDTSCHEENGSNHTAGAVWKEGQCIHCYCRKGEKVCAEEKCPHINCTVPYRLPNQCCQRCPGAVECIVSAWGSWGACPIQECGGGMRRRYRNVLVPPRNGGSFCPHMSEAQMCPRLPCNEIPVCPVTAWDSWSHCTATCGNGRRLRMRRRTKVTKATMTSLIDCATTHMQESMPCYTGTCNLALSSVSSEPDDDHCFAVTWSEWGPCSVPCGRGVQTRTQVLTNASHPLGHLCHLLQETKQCHIHECKASPEIPINCKVTHWSPWTPCSASCGLSAAKSKHRTILRHPSPGGRPCPILRKTRSCGLPPCSIVSQSSDTDQRCVSPDGTQHYAENERWAPVECISCVCVNARKVCQPMYCPESSCSDPVKFPGFCCPICLGE